MVWPAVVAGGAALAGLAGTVYSARQMRREAQKNREFQERMSSTAHQRSVADMRAAGINPMLAAGSPAATPSGATADVPDFGEGASNAVGSALAVKMARSQISHIDAQADQASSAAELARTQASDIAATAPGRLNLARAQAELAKASTEEKQQLLPYLMERAREEIMATAASAERTRMLTALDELREQGLKNIEEFERTAGEWGPWARLLFEGLRSVPRAFRGK